MPEQRISATLGSFPMGINSGVDPMLLPLNQLAFSTNSTNRGDFYKQRPSYKKLELQYNTDQTRGNFQMVTALFQGASYYLGISGEACLMLAVGGKLFKIVPSADTALVSQITLPDSGDSVSAVQNWLWQSERWLIWNDGISLPVFWDGTTARRSLGGSGAAVSIVTEPVGVVIPTAGQILSGLGVTSQYAGALNVPVIIGSNGSYGQYVIVGTGVGATITVQDVTGTLLSPSAGTSETKSVFNFSSLYQSRATAVTFAAATKTNWNQIPASGSPQTITINGPFSPTTNIYGESSDIQAYAARLPCDIDCLVGISPVRTLPTVAVGDKVKIGGKQCTVTSITNNTIAIPILTGGNRYIRNITSINVTPDSTYSGAVSGSIELMSSHTAVVNISNNSNTDSGVTTQTPNYGCSGWGWIAPYPTPTGVIGGTISGSPTWQPAGTSNFTITTLKPWTGPASGRIQLQGATIQLISYTGSTLTCQLLSAQSGAIVYNTVPASLTEIIKILDIGETLTPAGIDMSNRSTTGSVVYPLIQPVANSVTASDVGRPLLFQDDIGGTGYIYITAVAAHSPATTTEYTIDVKNVTGTPGGYINPGDSVYPLPEIPISTIGVYGMGRNWVCLPDGKSFVGCDIVGSSSGTLTPYRFTDSVLRVAQNQQLAGGGTFSVPGAGTKIKAMQFVAALDASLGQGALQVLTDLNIFSCNATTDIQQWSTMTSPILTESLIGSGAVSQHSVTQENSDLIFRSSDGGIRSMLLARLDFNKWGNTPISREVVRSISGDDGSLLPFCSSLTFNNRLMMLCKPTQRTRGVTHSAMVSLNFDSVSSMQGKQPSVWESEWQIPNALRLVGGFFSGVRRTFGICLDSSFGAIELVELLQDGSATQDYGSSPITWSIESPVMFNEPNHNYKRLGDGELYFRDVSESITGIAYYRADQSADWQVWYAFSIPYQVGDSGYRPRVGLGEPDANVFENTNNKPTREGYSFQVKLDISGACTLVGARFSAYIIPQPEFSRPL